MLACFIRIISKMLVAIALGIFSMACSEGFSPLGPNSSDSSSIGTLPDEATDDSDSGNNDNANNDPGNGGNNENENNDPGNGGNNENENNDPGNGGNEPDDVALIELENKARAFLSTNCSTCHGGGNSFGGVSNITDLNSLVDNGLVLPKDVDNSPLVQSMRRAFNPMPLGRQVSGNPNDLFDWIRGEASAGDEGENVAIGEPQCNGNETVPGLDTGLVQLNKYHVTNSIRDIFGVETNIADTLGEVKIDGFLMSAGQVVSSLESVLNYTAAVDDLADQIMSQSQARVIICNPQGQRRTCTREVISNLHLKVFRRPATTEDIDRIYTFIRQNTPSRVFRDEVKTALKYVLSSPNFYFRLETTPAPGERLGPYEMASRLSYFLTGSTPDDVLLEAAKNNQLSTDAQLESQGRRLLATQKAKQHLQSRFFSQWLELDKLNQFNPTAEQYPEFNEGLRTSMRGETDAFTAHIVNNDMSIASLLNPGFTYVNRDLASHYNISGVSGQGFRQVSSNQAPQRNGLLTHASLLTMSNHTPDESDIIHRGLYVMKKFACGIIPEQPAEIPPLGDLDLGDEPLTSRQIYELHRAETACNACHKSFDPYALPLENYDVIGRWRTFQTSARKFRLYARVRASTENNDTFFAALDGQALEVNQVTTLDQWTWMELGTSNVSFDKGQHNLRIRNRETGFRIDQVVVTTDFAFEAATAGQNITPSKKTLVLEAENAQQVDEVWSLRNSDMTSNNGFLRASARNLDPNATDGANNAGSIRFTFNIDFGGRVSLPIDASAELASGKPVDGVMELQQHFLSTDDFNNCVTKNLVKFGVGRGPSSQDVCAIQRVSGGKDGTNKSFSDTIISIIRSNFFRRTKAND